MFRRRPPAHATDLERERHPSWRRFTERYYRKKRIVRDLWLVSGLLMLAAPIGAIAAWALSTTFIAFMILDETA
ncbi:MAG TPA: hypothetical protein VKA64_05635 [Gammaproteobacteria bacterium]|nr:hypothetical protein [Gammaproteobacteria bacterium]